MNIRETLKKFINYWPYICKVNIIATGGGISLSQGMMIPGSSQVFSEVHIPYSDASQDAIFNDICKYNTTAEKPSKSVSKEMALFLNYWLINRYVENNDFVNVSVTAALSTVRINHDTKEVSFRKGNNEAYVSIEWPANLSHMRKDILFRINLNKINEEGMRGLLNTPGMIDHLRITEDEMISSIVLYKLSGSEEFKPDWYSNEFITML